MDPDPLSMVKVEIDPVDEALEDLESVSTDQTERGGLLRVLTQGELGPQELDEIAFVAVKEEPADELCPDKTERGGLLRVLTRGELDDTAEREVDPIAFVAVKQEPPEALKRPTHLLDYQRNYGGGSSCSFKGCNNTTHNTRNEVTAVRFFSFPTKDSSRCKEWIMKSGRDDFLDMDPKKLENRRVCSWHFLPEHLIGRCLRKDSVPSPAVNDASSDSDLHLKPTAIVSCIIGQDIKPANTSDPNLPPGEDATSDCKVIGDGTESSPGLRVGNVSTEVTELCGSDTESESEREERCALSGEETGDDDLCDDETTPKKLKLLVKSRKQMDKLDNTRSSSYRLNKRSVKPATIRNTQAAISEVIDGDAMTLTSMLIRHDKTAPWNSDQKKLALQLFYKSPSGYLYMLEKLKFNLPTHLTILRWINVVNLSPGFSELVYENLTTKVGTMSRWERECVLVYGAVRLERCLEYNPKQDLMEGFQDLGSLGRSPLVASQALVFTVRGLASDWKLPVGYVLALNAAPDTILLLLQECLEKLGNTGLSVRAVVADQGTANRSVFQLLDTSSEKPFFQFNSRKIFVVYDVPHLLRSVRDVLMERDLIVDGQVVTWKDIEEFHEIDARSGVQAAPKLSEKHLCPGPLARTSVKLAAQVFSRSVQSGMDSAIRSGQLRSRTAPSTARFVGRMNDLFDSLNSKWAHDRTTDDRLNSAVSCLKEAQTWLKSWTTVDKQPSPVCFEGFQLSVNSVLLLWEDLGSRLVTSRLSLDPLSSRPSARAVRRSVQHDISVRLMSPPKSSASEPPAPADARDWSRAEGCDLSPDYQETPTDKCASLDVDFPNLKRCGVAYIGSWLARRCVERFSCAACSACLVRAGDLLACDQETLTFARAFTPSDADQAASLTAPSQLFTNIVQEQCDTFSAVHASRKHAAHISKSIKRLIVEKQRPWFNPRDACHQHRLFSLNLLVLTTLHYYGQWISRAIQDARSATDELLVLNPQEEILKRKSSPHADTENVPQDSETFKKLKPDCT